MKATLTTMNPPHTTNVFEGRKIIEWRTFEMPKGLHYVYETKHCFGQGKVIGTMEISRSYSFNSVDEIPDYLIEAGCVPREFLEAYMKNKRKLFANVIISSELLKEPRGIERFKNYKTGRALAVPPQSYMYVEVLK